MVSLKSWARSDIGKKRLKNEDSYYNNDDSGLYMVADGMGGHRGGDKASKIAIKAAKDTFSSQIANGVLKNLALQKAFISAAKNVFCESAACAELRGMGTTLSALAITATEGYIGHIGDTRIYCFRDKKLHQLTNDHSLVNEQVQAGMMSPEEARKSSLRNIITRAIGQDKNVQPDFFSISVKKNDVFMLCTDGLNNMLNDLEILEIISSNLPNIAVKKLVLEANKKGGNDNISVILIRLV